MTRHLGLTLATGALLVACLAAQDDAPKAKGGKEPAKKQPADLPAAKDGKDAKPEAKPEAKPADKGESENPEKIIERLKEEFENAGTGLEKKDPGTKTRDVQKKIIDDLDKLINRQNEDDSKSCSSSSSPSSSSSSNSSNSSDSKSGAGKNSKSNKPKSDGLTKKNQPQGGAKKEDGQAKNQPKNGGQKKDQAQLKDGQKEKKNGQQQGTEKNNDTSAKKNPIPDENRPGAWGHLTPKMRKEMEAFSRDHMVPRYQAMSMQYFKRTAQHGRGKEGE